MTVPTPPWTILVRKIAAQHLSWFARIRSRIRDRERGLHYICIVSVFIFAE